MNDIATNASDAPPGKTRVGLYPDEPKKKWPDQGSIDRPFPGFDIVSLASSQEGQPV